MAALLRHLGQDLVDGKLAGAKAVFFLPLSSFPYFFEGEKKLPSLFCTCKKKDTKTSLFCGNSFSASHSVACNECFVFVLFACLTFR